MNAAISNPKADLLLGAGLNVLHFESGEWIETLKLWKDEVRFFEDLLKRKEPIDKDKQEFSVVLKTLDKIHNNLFNDFEEEIMAHERVLSQLELNTNGVSDGAYRDVHRRLSERMETFKKDFTQFKSIVFNYAKHL
ncbi:hypothetical protein [Winogradskyella sp. PC D3.3]